MGMAEFKDEDQAEMSDWTARFEEDFTRGRKLQAQGVGKAREGALTTR